MCGSVARRSVLAERHRLPHQQNVPSRVLASVHPSCDRKGWTRPPTFSRPISTPMCSTPVRPRAVPDTSQTPAPEAMELAQTPSTPLASPDWATPRVRSRLRVTCSECSMPDVWSTPRVAGAAADEDAEAPEEAHSPGSARSVSRQLELVQALAVDGPHLPAPAGAAVSFESLFGLPPRPVQREAMRFLDAHGVRELCVMELDTGSGKSNLGVWQIVRALQTMQSAIYTCSSCFLQSEIARTMAAVHDDGSVGARSVRAARVLFGRGQYWCHARASAALARGTLAAPTARFVEATVLGFDPEQAPDDFWHIPMRAHFDRACREQGVRADDWSQLSAEGCSCARAASSEEESEARMRARARCPQVFAWDAARRARVKVVNTSLLLTFVGQGLLLAEAPLYVVFDEAHLLPTHADALLSRELPPTLRAEEVDREVAGWHSRGARRLVGALRIADALRASTDRRRIAFEIEALRSHMASVQLHVRPRQATDLASALAEAEERLARLRRTVRAALRTASPREAYERALADFAPALGAMAPYDEHELASALEARALAEATALARADALLELPPAFAADLHRLARTDTLADLHTAAANIARVVGAVDTLRMATQRSRWMEACDLVVPVAVDDAEGVRVEYVPSRALRARALLELLWGERACVAGALLMSATLRNVGLLDDEDPYRTFLRETGLADATRVVTHTGAAAFDRNRTVLVAPPMTVFDAHAEREDPGRAARRLTTAVEEIVHAVRLNPRSTLVCSPSHVELREVRSRLERALPERRHIDFADRASYDDFARSDAHAIVYGCDALATGVDLRGRLGLVVGTRPLNRRHDDALREYESNVLKSKERYWEAYNFERLQRTLQMVGRLQRCPEDRGVALLLSDRHTPLRDGDSALVCRHYQSRGVKRARLAVVASDF